MTELCQMSDELRDISPSLLLKRLEVLSARPLPFVTKPIKSATEMSSAEVKNVAKRNVALAEDEISVIHDSYFSSEEADRSFLSDPSYSCKRNYIPSPISSPATARRLSQRLGDQLSRHSPRLARKRFNQPIPPLQPQQQQPQQSIISHEPTPTSSCPRCQIEADQVSAAQPPMTSSPRDPESGANPGGETFSFLSFCSSILFPSSSSVRRRKKRNQFLNYFVGQDHDSDEFAMAAFHKFSDAGRIASRHHESKWDAWTSMGENVHNYEAFCDDSDDENVSEDDEDGEEDSTDDEDDDGNICDNLSADSSTSDDSNEEFLDVPLNDMSLDIRAGHRCQRGKH